jgi:hypothetical protein
MEAQRLAVKPERFDRSLWVFLRRTALNHGATIQFRAKGEIQPAFPRMPLFRYSVKKAQNSSTS